MLYTATIQFLDEEEPEEMTVSTGDVGEDADDDQIFYYFKSEAEMDEFKIKGINDFVVLDYSKN